VSTFKYLDGATKVRIEDAGGREVLAASDSLGVRTHESGVEVFGLVSDGRVLTFDVGWIKQVNPAGGGLVTAVLSDHRSTGSTTIMRGAANPAGGAKSQ
jgi:hypothetical protein